MVCREFLMNTISPKEIFAHQHIRGGWFWVLVILLVIAGAAWLHWAYVLPGLNNPFEYPAAIIWIEFALFFLWYAFSRVNHTFLDTVWPFKFFGDYNRLNIVGYRLVHCMSGDGDYSTILVSNEDWKEKQNRRLIFPERTRLALVVPLGGWFSGDVELYVHKDAVYELCKPWVGTFHCPHPATRVLLHKFHLSFHSSDIRGGRGLFPKVTTPVDIQDLLKLLNREETMSSMRTLMDRNLLALCRHLATLRKLDITEPRSLALNGCIATMWLAVGQLDNRDKMGRSPGAGAIKINILKELRALGELKPGEHDKFIRLLEQADKAA